MDEFADRYYRDSGAVPFPSNIVLPIAAVAAALGAGGLYGFLAAWNPLVILSVIGTFAAGALIGGCVLMVGRACGIRNNAFAGLVGLLAGVVGVYAEWVVFIWATWGPILLDPTEVWAGFQAAAESESWSIKGWTFNETTLYVFWAADALGVAFTATIVATMRTDPYCEECQRWMNDGANGLRFAATDESALRTELEAERYETLDSLSASATVIDDDDCFRAEVFCCDGECDQSFLTLTRVKGTYDGKGERSESTDIAVNRLRIPIELAGQLTDPEARKRFDAVNDDVSSLLEPIDHDDPADDGGL